MIAEDYYRRLVVDASDVIAFVGGRARIVSWLRVLVFTATIAGIYFYWDIDYAWGAIAVTGIIVFLALVKYHDKLMRRRSRQETLLELAQSRLRVLAGDLSQQPDGSSHIDPMHRYSYDLDVFGRNSLFSMLNSTSTPIGALYLAQWLKTPLLDADEIKQRQNAISELSQMNSLRTEFHASGKTIEKDTAGGTPDFENIPSFRLPRVLTVMAYLACPIFIASIVLCGLGLIPGTTIVWLIIAYLGITAMVSKRIGRLHQWLCMTVESLTSRVELFKQIEGAYFSSTMMRDFQKRFYVKDKPASQNIRHLARLLKSLDQRYNAAGFILFNGTMMWDIITIHRIDRQLGRCGKELAMWQRTIGEIDALSSLATYAFENPEYVYPHIDRKGDIIMQAIEMGHPLIPKSQRVNNQFQPMSQHSFMIVTGANMAGKSTYLRTIGVNYLLATIGAPVAAKLMFFTPTILFTGLRANDSLANGESYFFAELKRLQAVVNEASQGTPMFILLDEILRGTNSADKQRGSLALVKRLITLPVAGVLATHDLVLGGLAQEFPENISAYCFEADINGDSLTFDYTLRKGIAHNLNAYFLMEKMGIV